MVAGFRILIAEEFRLGPRQRWPLLIGTVLRADQRKKRRKIPSRNDFFFVGWLCFRPGKKEKPPKEEEQVGVVIPATIPRLNPMGQVNQKKRVIRASALVGKRGDRERNMLDASLKREDILKRKEKRNGTEERKKDN